MILGTYHLWYVHSCDVSLKGRNVKGTHRPSSNVRGHLGRGRIDMHHLLASHEERKVAIIGVLAD